MSIIVDDVVFEYKDGTRALNGASFRVDPGERVAIIGQNGAGKTTVAKLMNSLLKPTSGKVSVNGVLTRDVTTAQIARQVAYVFQNPDDQLFKSEVRAEIAYLGKILSIPADQIDSKVLEVAGLAGVAQYLDVNPKDLPLAVRKFVAIAALLMGDAEYVVLDEPTAGLDLLGGNRLIEIMDHLSGKGTAIVTICHDMRFVIENFDRVIAMAGGRVVSTGTPAEVFAHDSVLSQCAVKRPEATELAAELGMSNETIRLEDIRHALNTLNSQDVRNGEIN